MNQQLILSAIEALQLTPGMQRVQQVRKIDSVKNKTDLMRAAQEKNIENLKKLLELGVDPNFRMERQGYCFSPLAMSCLQKHEEAVALLLDHGADENVVLQDLKPNEVYNSNAVVMAVQNENEDILNLVYERHKDTPALTEKLKTATSPKVVMTLLDLGFYDLPQNKGLESQVFDKLLEGINRWRMGSYIKVIEAMYKRYPELKKTHSTQLWKMGIEYDQWMFCQRLAKEGVALKDWQLPLGKIYLGYSSGPHEKPKQAPGSLMIENSNRGSYGAYYIQKPETEKAPIDPIGFALRHQSASCLEAFLKVPPLREMYENNTLSKDFAVFANEKCLAVLKDAGVEMSSIKESTWGITPLHYHLSESYRVRKTGLMNMLQLEPQWALMQDNEGKSAVEYVRNDANRTEVQSLIDDKVLRKLSPKKGVKKSTTSGKKRL